jgi:hypothetical protein
MDTRDDFAPTCCSELRAVALRSASQPREEPKENVGLVSWLLQRSQVRRRARRLELMRQQDNQRLASRVQDILVGRGLTQAYYGITGGRSLYVPQVMSVVTGPPVGLYIRTLPGQTPDDFAAHAPAIAYNLGVVEVRVVPIDTSLIRLELLPGPS